MKVMLLLVLIGSNASAFCRTQTVFQGSRVEMVQICDAPEPTVYNVAPIQPANLGGHNDDLYQGVDRFQRGLKDLNQ